MKNLDSKVQFKKEDIERFEDLEKSYITASNPYNSLNMQYGLSGISALLGSLEILNGSNKSSTTDIIIGAFFAAAGLYGVASAFLFERRLKAREEPNNLKVRTDSLEARI